MRGLIARLASMIRVEAGWLCIEPMDMRAGTDTTLVRVVKVFGAARPHHAYVFANKRSTRLKVLVRDGIGIGIWLAARSLHQGLFIWPGGGCGAPQSLKREQLDALVLGLPWHRRGDAGCAMDLKRRLAESIAWLQHCVVDAGEKAFCAAWPY